MIRVNKVNSNAVNNVNITDQACEYFHESDIQCYQKPG